VVTLLQGFDGLYGTLLNQLQSTWTQGQAQLNAAVSTMFQLAGPAQQLMQIPIANGNGLTYGPDFYLGGAG
jgi:hypothetical protein